MSADQGAAPADPRIRSIHEALESGRIGGALAAAKALVAEAETEELALKAHALAGMACFHLGTYEPAAVHFEATAAGLPSRPAWFRVALARTLAGEVELGAEAFAKAVQADEDDPLSKELTVPFMRFDYAGALVAVGAIEEAREQVRRLQRIFESLSRTDDAHVLAQGIPAVDHFIGLALDVYEAGGSVTEPKRWARDFARKLDDHGRKRLAEVGAMRKAGLGRAR